VARASILEPLFDDARVVCVRGPWNDDWMSEIGGFPSSAHDDQVDSLVVASYIEITAKGRTSITT
jgi:predicted phage terminase large subunit-like protein